MILRAVGLASCLTLLFACGGSSSNSPPPSAPGPTHTSGADARREPAGERSIEEWDRSHPDAARELGAWVRAHPEAAELFFEWDAHHPEATRAFVTWAIRHPGDSIDVFVLEHPRWDYFDRISEQHRPAAEAFIVWARRHAQAAEALANHPRGLEWAGDHLYAAERKIGNAHR
jgi:hypothetical protein